MFSPFFTILLTSNLCGINIFSQNPKCCPFKNTSQYTSSIENSRNTFSALSLNTNFFEYTGLSNSTSLQLSALSLKRGSFIISALKRSLCRQPGTCASSFPKLHESSHLPFKLIFLIYLNPLHGVLFRLFQGDSEAF